MAFRLLRLCF